MNIEVFNKEGVSSLLMINMDETPIYFDMQRNYTYHWRGDKTVSLARTNGFKKRVTVCLTILSDGRKLPPLIIFKRKQPPANPLSKQVQVAAQVNGWITETIMKDWVNNIYKKMKLPLKTVKLLLLDHCSAHIKDSVKTLIQEEGHLDFIPPGTTSLIQPLDLMINKSFKENLKTDYCQWLEKEGLKDKNKTARGYYKAPSYSKIIRMVNDSWKLISPELIEQSFKYSGNNY